MEIPEGTPFHQILDNPKWQLAAFLPDHRLNDDGPEIDVKFEDFQDRWLGPYDLEGLRDLLQILQSTRKFSEMEFAEFLSKLQEAEVRITEIHEERANQPRQQSICGWLKARFFD